ncbi:TIGR01906 family membrane protein [Lachnotalea sp. AF33-28]|jgi:integral membrane protein (TIGR01906 family)|uniref:TIGR01906 family membrane protein n=1 Tax=Lachnotalea sp. AF33-28 TaxID=2292046 RepID=UPI000E48CAD3|nr:TIGR01906 family membrane protein [Lachnotalea sp. AF33-28]RHP30725.1 TIGR01906 family membrane protein [Lachnotalea sp. AF33-28]
MKFLDKLTGVLCAVSIILILLITSVEAVVYFIPGYFQREYEKYSVPAAINVEMDELLRVTDEMMDYLKDKRDDLHINSIVGGQPREFFNQREISHMEDVKSLFMGAIWIRRICAAVLVLGIAALLLRKRRTLRVLASSCLGVSAVIAAVTAVIAVYMSSNFTAAFNRFHEIFFDNDLWILDPATDLLINIVPEGFFVDTALRIGLLFGGSMLVLLAASLIITVRGAWSRKGKPGKESSDEV